MATPVPGGRTRDEKSDNPWAKFTGALGGDEKSDNPWAKPSKPKGWTCQNCKQLVPAELLIIDVAKWITEVC